MSAQTPRVRVLLVDDHLLFRKGISALLSDDRRIQVVGEAANGQEAVEMAEALSPNVVLMDLQMPVRDGISATRLIRETAPSAKVLVLTVSDEDATLFEAIKAGAHGYLMKNDRPDVLASAIVGVVNGEAPLSGAVASKLLAEFSRVWSSPAPAPSGTALSGRELEILSMVADGASNRLIAAKLVIAEGTVKNHLHNILEKLHLRNRAEAAAYVTRSGLRKHP